jgi:hypothetical protein
LIIVTAGEYLLVSNAFYSVKYETANDKEQKYEKR